MKHILSLLLFICISVSLLSQPKTAYVSIDVSASMRGDKYNLANYMVQMITALMENDDELYLSICSDYKKIAINTRRQAEIDALQKSIYSIKVNYYRTEIADIIEFMDIYKPQSDREQWYFIVGDGYWNGTEVVCESFSQLISENPVRVCFLETMEELDEHGNFGECMDNLKFVAQYRSSNNPQTIINNCLQVATTLFGVSNEPAAVKQVSDKVYSFQSQMSVKKIYVVYQDEVGKDALPLLQLASQGNTNINIARQSIVSTEKTRHSSDEVLLSGQVIVLSPSALLKANEDIQLTFNTAIDKSKLKIYPMVDAGFGEVSILADTGIPQTSGNETVICLENNRVKIIYEVTDSEGNELPENILHKTVTSIVTELGEYQAVLNNGVFECEVPLNNRNELSYVINAKCGGYFNIASERKKIIRSADCVMPVEGEMRSTGDIHINELLNGGATIGMYIVDRNDPNNILDPREHTIDVKQDYRHLFKNIQVIDVTSTDFKLKFEARNIWCECFIPDAITVTVYSADKTGKYQPSEKKLELTIDKSGTTWYKRCYRVIIGSIVLFLVILYLMAIGKKKRFKKGACIRYQYFGVGGIKSRENTDDLRAKGFFAWIYRWFIPFGNEKSSKFFNKAGNKLFTFAATKSNRRIEFPKTQYNPKEMSSIDFDRDLYEKRDVKTFTMTDNTMIKITLPNGTGSFQFCYDRASGVGDDVPAFKVFVNILLFVAIVCEAVLFYLLISSLF